MARLLVRSLFAAAVFLFATTVLVAQNDDPPTGGGAQTDCVGEGCGGGGADEMAPVIDLMTPSNGATVSAASPFIQIEYCDNVSVKSNTRSITLNGSSVTSSFTHSSVTPLGDCGARKKDESSSVVLTPGTNYLSASICDLVGNCNTGNWTIVYSVQAPPIVTLKNFNADNQDRGMCLTLGAGQAAGLSCGDLFVTHSMPTYRTMGRDRALTLFYSSAAAAPRPVVAAVVTQSAATATPTSVFAQLTVAGTIRASATYSAFGAADGARQIVLSFDAAAAGLATGVYSFTLLVQNNYAVGGPEGTSYSGELLINSRAGSEFGSGWSVLGVESIACLSGCNRILWTGGDGSIALYNRVGGVDRWARVAGAYQDTIVKNAADTLLPYTRYLRHGVQVRFNPSGLHFQTINRAGQATVFNWDTLPGNPSRTRLLSVTVPKVSGTAQTYVFGYEGGWAPLDYIQDPAGRRIEPYIGTSTSNGWTISYIDDADAGRTSFAYDSLGRMTGRTNRRNHRTSYFYANGLHVTRFTVPLNPASSDSSRDSSRTRITWWDEQGLAIGTGSSLSAVDTSLSYTKVFGPRVNVADDATFRVDRWGAPVHIVGAVADTTTLKRSATTGLVSRVRTPAGSIFGMTYDARGNLLASSDSTHEGHGTGGNQVATSRYTYKDSNAPDSPDSVIDPMGIVRLYGYTSIGLPNLVTAPDGHQTRISYGSSATAGLVTSITELLVPTYTDTTTWSNFPSTTNDSQQTRFAFDALGNVDTTWSPMGHVSLLRYNAYTQVDSTIDAIGGVTQYFVRPMGVVDSVVQLGWAGERRRYWNEYDEEFNRTRFRDPRNVRREWTYDQGGRAITELNDVSSTQTATETRYVGPSGLLDSLTTRSSVLIRHTYDAGGRRTQTRFPYRDSASISPGDTINMTYDVAGRMLSARNRNGVIVRQYYREGTIQRDSQNIGYAFTQAFRYNLADQRTWYNSFEGAGTKVFQTDYEYALGNLYRVIIDYPGSTLSTDTATYSWEADGRRSQLVTPNGATVRWFYDLEGRVRRVRSTHTCTSNCGAEDSAVVDKRYRSYTPLGYPTSILEYVGMGSASDSFTYDAYGQLRLRYRGASNWRDYRYDLSGNIVEEWRNGGGVKRSSIAPSTNRLAADTLWNGSTAFPMAQYLYSNAGERTQDVPSWDLNLWRDMWYDGLGRLASTGVWATSVSGPVDDNDFSMGQAGSTISGSYVPRYDSCRYDALGRRSKVCGGLWTMHDGNQVTWVDHTRIMHGASIDEPLVVWDSAFGVVQRYYFITDGAGKLLSYTDRNGNDGRLAGSPLVLYSERAVQGGAIANAEGYGASAGESGDLPDVSYFRNRYYDQRTGRWLQEDPIGIAGGSNLYSYSANNPVTFTDPFGLCPPVEDCIAKGMVAGSSVGAAAGLIVAAGCAVTSDGACLPFAGQIVGAATGFGATVGGAIGQLVSEFAGRGRSKNDIPLVNGPPNTTVTKPGEAVRFGPTGNAESRTCAQAGHGCPGAHTHIYVTGPNGKLNQVQPPRPATPEEIQETPPPTPKGGN